MATKPLQSITLTNDNGEDTTYVVATAPAIVETTESASVASFSDGAEGIPVTSLIADINPVQNLNGQSAPYPAGGGKNLLQITATSQTISEVTFTIADDGTIIVNGTANANAILQIGEITLSAGDYIANGISGGNGGQYLIRIADGSSTVKYVYDGDTSFTISADATLQVYIYIYSGITVTNLALSPMIRHSTESDATFAPYSNICPITGWTGMNVVRNGFNQLDEEWELGAYDGTTGAKVTNTTNLRSKNAIPVLPNTAYYAKSPVAMYIFEYDASGNFIGYTTRLNSVLTTGASTHFLRFYMLGSYGTTYNNDISINYPATDTDYHAYNGTTYPISWQTEAGTVYGGTLDVTTGLLTVEYVKYTISSFAGVWGAVNAGYAVYASVADTDHTIAIIDPSSMVSNIFKYEGVSRTSMSLYAYGGNDGANATQTFILPSTITSKAEANAWLANLGYDVECTFRLATPTTYQLTPQAVLTILGQNNIWADTGDVEVAYCADTKMYIDNLIAAL